MSNFDEEIEQLPALNGEVPAEEKPPFECLTISEDKLKYTKPDFESVNARLNDRKSDVKLKVGDKTFKGHRKVLKDASEYFSAMFSHEMKEKDEKEIEIKEISVAGFTAMLDYFYHGVVTIEPKVVPDILEAARFFHVDWVLDVCCDFMMGHLYLVDYALTMHLADTYSLGDLRWEIFRNFGTNLPLLVERENFLKDLSADLLLQFLMEYMFVEVSEFFLLQLIVNWVHADEGARKEHFLPLLRQLRFPTMDLEELETIPKEVLEFQEIREEIEAAKMYCFDVASQCLKTEDKYLPRGSRPTIIVMSFNDETQHNVVVYKDPENPDSNLFIENLGESGLGTDYSTSCQGKIGNFLFSVGGYGFDNYTSSGRMFRYEPKLREWEEVATMNEPRVSFAICSSATRLYVCGGVFHKIGDLEEPEKILSSVEMYNPEENAWKVLAALPQGCFDLAAAFHNNVLYISGGISDVESKPVPVGETYCLTEGNSEWTPMAPMLTPRQGHSMTAHNDKLYVIGGYKGSEYGEGFKDCFENEIYDIETKQWTAIAPTPENYGHLFRHVAFYANKIYFLCNQDADAYLCAYDTETDTFGEGVFIGPGFHKVGLLQIAYPHT